ncbi:MAG TPA: hypothetical protein EYQ26_16185 [Rhodospirillales bacterium]|jgi:hypothetical protein|nr:hypothetical protein [Rhodospirillales bacterium]HIL74606.1 hypothetical protein [Rhodospirillales bacterium]
MFFDEIKEVEKNVADLKTDLVAIREGVEGSFDQLDDIAAHIIALEAILVEVIKKTPIDADAVKAWIVEATGENTGGDGGKTKSEIIVDSLLKGETLPKN